VYQRFERRIPAMKLRTTWIVAAVCLLEGAAQLSAQSARAYNFFISGEYGFAVSPEDFTDYYTKGIGFGLGIEYPVS
jgi:hypothetical protein